MKSMVITRDELKNSPALKGSDSGEIHLDVYETVIIVTAIAALAGALMSGHLSETAFVGLIGTFFGYTFGRIFNHYQGKE